MLYRIAMEIKFCFFLRRSREAGSAGAGVSCHEQPVRGAPRLGVPGVPAEQLAVCLFVCLFVDIPVAESSASSASLRPGNKIVARGATLSASHCRGRYPVVLAMDFCFLPLHKTFLTMKLRTYMHT